MEGKEKGFYHFNEEKIIWCFPETSQISIPVGTECQRLGSMEIMERKWFQYLKSRVLKSGWTSKILIPQVVHVDIQWDIPQDS